MVGLRGLGLAAMVTVAAATAVSPASAYWGGYRGYGYGYRGYGYGGFGPDFGPGFALGGYYGGYYARPYAYPPPYYLPPVIYSPPGFLPPPAYAALPRPRPIAHRVRPSRVVAQCHCLPPMPTNVPAALRDIPSLRP